MHRANDASISASRFSSCFASFDACFSKLDFATSANARSWVFTAYRKSLETSSPCRFASIRSMSMFCSSSSPKASSSFASSKVFGTIAFWYGVRLPTSFAAERRWTITSAPPTSATARWSRARSAASQKKRSLSSGVRFSIPAASDERSEINTSTKKAFVSENRSALDARRWLSICSKYTRPWPTYSPSAVRVSRDKPLSCCSCWVR